MRIRRKQDLESATEYLWFSTRERRAHINITDRIEEIVRGSRIKEGLCLVNAMHITASVYWNGRENWVSSSISEA